jgi:hypothetical protein
MAAVSAKSVALLAAVLLVLVASAAAINAGTGANWWPK